jgi:glycosyltransferase involved in cell wall biosynthesis
MSDPVSISVIINNHNYAGFVGEAIQSALDQTVAPLEVIVVDDGSTDDSRRVIESFGDSIKAVYQENSGQASAINRGCSLAKGDLFCLLDADDLFYPGKLEEIARLFATGICREKGPALISHTLEVVSADGQSKGWTMPPHFKDIRFKNLPPTSTAGLLSTPADTLDFIRRHAMPPYLGSTTSGLIFNRALYSMLFPLPVLDHVKSTGDGFIIRGGMLLGNTYALQKKLGAYRAHGNNAWYSGDVGKPGTAKYRTKRDLSHYEPWLNTLLISLATEIRIDYAASSDAFWFYQYTGNSGKLLRLTPRLLKRGLNRRNLLVAGYALWSALLIELSRLRSAIWKV